MEQFTIGGLTAKRGEKVNGFISVEGTRIQLPVTLICGTTDGETVLSIRWCTQCRMLWEWSLRFWLSRDPGAGPIRSTDR